MQMLCNIRGIFRETKQIGDWITCYKKIIEVKEGEYGISRNTYNCWHRDEEKWPLKAALKQVVKRTDPNTKILIFYSTNDKFDFFHRMLEYIYEDVLSKIDRIQVLEALRNSDNEIRKKGIILLQDKLNTTQWDSSEVIQNRAISLLVVFCSLTQTIPNISISSDNLLENTLKFAYNDL